MQEPKTFMTGEEQVTHPLVVLRIKRIDAPAGCTRLYIFTEMRSPSVREVSSVTLFGDDGRFSFGAFRPNQGEPMYGPWTINARDYDGNDVPVEFDMWEGR